MDLAAQTHKTLSIAPRRAQMNVGNSALCVLAAATEAGAAIAIGLAATFGYLVLIQGRAVGTLPWGIYLAQILFVAGVAGALACATYSQRLERSLTLHRALIHGVCGWTAASGFAVLGAFLFGVADELSRVVLGSTYVAGLILMPMIRRRLFAGIGRRIAAGRLQLARFAIIGNRSDVVGFLMAGDLWRSGYRLSGVLYLEDASVDGSIVEDKLDRFARACAISRTQLVVLAGPVAAFGTMEQIGAAFAGYALDTAFARVASETGFAVVDVLMIGPQRLLRMTRRPLGDIAIACKRAFDLATATLALIGLGPLMAITALAIRLDSPGPVFFRQERRGFNGETFLMWKFRSMRVTENGYAAVQAVAGDKRITRVGRFLRRASIDELPQLFNVLAGDMSLVGPRPHALAHDDAFARQIEAYAKRRRIRPGITGWAQVNGWRGETVTLEDARQRTLHDLAYVDDWSFWWDVAILILTVISPRAHRNAR